MTLTTPEVGAWTGALTALVASAIFCPLSTRSPTATQGSAGAPRCCASGTISRLGNGGCWIGVPLESVLCSGG